MNFLFIIQPITAQKVYVLDHNIDSENTFHDKGFESIFKAILLIHQTSLDTSNAQRLVLIDQNVLETYLLNKILRDTANTISDFERVLFSEESTLKNYVSCIRGAVNTYPKEQRRNLAGLTFVTIDPALDIQSLNEFRIRVLFLWDDVFKGVPQSRAPLALKSIRSFVRYYKQLHNNWSDDSMEETASVKASFNVRGTLDYCLDSIEIFDSLSQAMNCEYNWQFVREFIRLSNSNYKEYRDIAEHYSRIKQAAPQWFDKSVDGELWLIENNPNGANRPVREYTCSQLLAFHNPNLLFQTHFFTENINHTNSNDTVWHALKLYDELMKVWPLAEYDFINPESVMNEEQEAYTKEDEKVRFLLGGIVNSAINESNIINENFENLGLKQVNLGNAMGLEFGIEGLGDGILMNFQWSGQNHWLNWDSRAHFAYTNFRFSSNIPFVNTPWLSSYLGFDYQYEKYRIALPVNQQFIGNPLEVPVVVSNDGQNIGIFTQVIFRLHHVYAKAQLGYRWDFSDDRWYSDGISINSMDRFRSSGLHYGLGLGFVIFGGNEN